MRIAYVSTDPGIPVFGMKGGSIHIQEMLRAFLSLGARVTIISSRLEGEPPADLAGLARISLPSLPKQDPKERARSLLAMNATVAEAIDEVGPFDLVYERHALFAHGAMEHAAERGLRRVLEVNAPLIAEQTRYRELALPDFAALSTRRAMQAASVISVVSAEVRTYCTEHGAAENRVHVLPNAVNPRRFPERPAPEEPFTIGFLGTLKPWHDVRTAIDALALMHRDAIEARLLIVGDGPERPRLQAQVAELGLRGAVEFAGLVHPNRVPDELARMHVAVAPYSDEGPFYFSPLKLYEYMAAGLPVVASRVGHLPDVVAEGRTGLLCAPGDAQDLASALTRLGRSPELRGRLGAAARGHVLAHHNWDRVAGRVLEFVGLAAQPLQAAPS